MKRWIIFFAWSYLHYFPSELSSLRSLSSWLGNSTISGLVIRGFRGKDVLSPKR